ncbi:MAG TPA: tripartite tricarboxylate transporter substrate binding protein [Xanthobacteraceae bacterium]|nr:tripartite tricarboxylate transporter substrate binding protein [Xanthobacteraceae bacterium]
MAAHVPRPIAERAVQVSLAVLAAGVVLALATIAAAQNYPTRPITLVVPFPPGGSTTIVARIVTDRMADAIGQQFVVDNRGGAGGTLGTRQVAKSTPDGYTLALGYTGTLAIAPSLFPNVGYDVRTDFTPLGRIGMAPSTLVVHPSFPVNSVAELIAYARANPGKVNYGSAGIGTVGHVAGEYFAIETGIKLTHIPYKGTGPAITDLLGGHIPLTFSPIPAVHESAKSGLLRMLAVTSAKRSSLVPDTPTIAESGVPGFEAVLRYGLVAPAGTPRPIVDRLNRALRAALESEEVRNRLAIEGAEPLPSSPEEYAADLDHEETQWSKVIKASGAKAE